MSFRSEARNPGFNKFSTLRFLTEPALSQILQSLRSFRMTERRIRNDIFLIATQPLEGEGLGEGEIEPCPLERLKTVFNLTIHLIIVPEFTEKGSSFSPEHMTADGDIQVVPDLVLDPG